jgi:hypothetical protein
MNMTFEDFIITIATEENFPQDRVTLRNFIVSYPHWVSTDKSWYELRYRAWSNYGKWVVNWKILCYSRTGWKCHFDGVTGEGKSLAEAKADHHVKYQKHLS